MLTLPVKILSETDSQFVVQTINKIENCETCKAGNGCGQTIWFRGLIKTAPFAIQKPAHFHHDGFAEITITKKSFNFLLLCSYGLPLLAFLLSLFLFSNSPAIVQFLGALLSLFAAYFFLKNRLNKHILNHVSLQNYRVS